MIRLAPIPTRGRIAVALLDEVERRLPLEGGVASAALADAITSHGRARVRAALLQLRREGRADFEGPMGARLWRRLPVAEAASLAPAPDAHRALNREVATS